MDMKRTFTLAEVDAHSSENDVYLVVHGKVHNVTDFLDRHPGGRDKLLEPGVSDVSEFFEDASHSDDARGLLGGMCIGVLEGSSPTTTVTTKEPLRTVSYGISSWRHLEITSVLVLLGLVVYQFSSPVTNRS